MSTAPRWKKLQVRQHQLIMQQYTTGFSHEDEVLLLARHGVRCYSAGCLRGGS